MGVSDILVGVVDYYYYYVGDVVQVGDLVYFFLYQFFNVCW